MKCSQACCPFWVQLSVKFNVRKRTKKKKTSCVGVQSKPQFCFDFFSWATWFKKEMAYSDYATGADMEGVYRGMQKRCQWNNTDRKHLQFNLSDFILISKCAFVCFS